MNLILCLCVCVCVVRKVLYYSLEAEKKGTEQQAREKAALYDKLGDLCCELKAFPGAVKFYGKQVWCILLYISAPLIPPFHLTS